MHSLFRAFSIIFLFVWILTPMPVAAQQAGPTTTPSPSPPGGLELATPDLLLPAFSLAFPQSGELLRGVIPITGSVDVPGLTSWELSFSYSADTTGTWFLLATGTERAAVATLYDWDTSLLADGNYSLRLRAYTGEGLQEVISQELRIRNYSVDTPTPTLTPTITPSPTLTPTPLLPTYTPTPTRTLVPTPTNLPPNPLVVSTDQITLSLLQGAGLILVLFAVLGGLVYLRNRFLGD